MNREQEFLKTLDHEYGFRIAKDLLQFKSLQEGFRMAGTDAENAAADWIADEMRAIGLQNVQKESFPVDSWDYKGATLKLMHSNEDVILSVNGFSGVAGTEAGGITAPLVYVGDGTAAGYEDKDVAGKIVFVDTNSYHSYPYAPIINQAEARGAAAFIASPAGGPGTYRDELITVQDIMGTSSIPCAMTSKGTGDYLRGLLQAGEEPEVNLRINATIDPEGQAHYVHGEIPGKNPQRFILVGGHYDAYWDGFQDNATSLGSLMTIAKAMLDMGYEPEGTIVFLINGAEEYGKTNCYYDFAHSVRYVLEQHPEWAKGTIGYNNFELTGYCETGNFVAVSAHGYTEILDQWLNGMDFLKESSVFPDPSVQADDVVFSKSGVPSFMNVYMIEAEGPDSFELFDHTAWDNVDRFDADVFAENNKAFGLLDMRLDQVAAAPLNLAEITQACQSEEGYELLAELYPDFRQWEAGLQKLEETAAQMYDTVCGLNAKAANCRGFFADRKRKKCYDEGWECTKAVLAANRMLQQDVLKYDAFMTLIFGHRQPCAYVTAIDALIEELAAGQAGQALEALCGLDNNYLIAEFDKEVYQKVALDAFTPERTAGSWGEGQTMPFPDLQDVLLSIMEKTEADQAGSADFAEEIKMLQAVREEQYGILAETMEKESAVFRKAAELLQPHVSKKAAKKKKAEADETLSINSKVKDLLKSPEAVEIIERHAPGATSNPDLKWVMNMKLKNVAPISEGMLTSEMLEAIDIDLKKL